MRGDLIALGFIGAATLGLIALVGFADNREGHGWCDGTALALHRPVEACMGAWNRGGATEVVRWARAEQGE